MPTSVVIAVLAFATAVLAVGWAVAARRFARVLRTVTEGVQLAAASGLATRSSADEGSMSDASSDGLTILEPLESRLRLFCRLALDMARLSEATVAE